MKHIFSFVLLCTISILSFSQITEFEKGFKNGFQKGYCYDISFGCLPPVTPICPLPNLNETSNSFMDGYNKGFLVGKQTQDFESNKQKGLVNLYPNYIEPSAPFRSSDYTKPVDLELLYQVNSYKQKLYDARRQWIQEQIDLMYLLNYCFVSTNSIKNFESINNKIDDFVKELNPKGGIDLTNNYNFSQIANVFSSIRKSIFNFK